MNEASHKHQLQPIPNSRGHAHIPPLEPPQILRLASVAPLPPKKRPSKMSSDKQNSKRKVTAPDSSDSRSLTIKNMMQAAQRQAHQAQQQMNQSQSEEPPIIPPAVPNGIAPAANGIIFQSNFTVAQQRQQMQQLYIAQQNQQRMNQLIGQNNTMIPNTVPGALGMHPSMSQSSPTFIPDI